MTVEDFAVLDVSRYELRLRARASASLPVFLGSTLRGAFGHALKEAVCVMNHRQCERCLVADRCIYPYLFETPAPQGVEQLRGQQQAPHPFILTPPVLEAEEKSARAVAAAGRERVVMHSTRDGRTVRLVHPPEESGGRRRLIRGDELKFELLLMGRAVEYLPYVVYAVSEMAQRGLGVERARFELVDAAMIDERGERQQIYSGERQRISVHEAATKDLSELISRRLEEMADGLRGERLRLKFLTPARIRVEGDLQVGMSFNLLVRSLLRRVSLLAAVHGRKRLELDYRGLIERASGVERVSSSLRWFDWERYSNRQQTKMALGGFTGEVEYGGEAIKEYLPLVAAGEILHVGGSTGFGLGRYEIVR